MLPPPPSRGTGRPSGARRGRLETARARSRVVTCDTRYPKNKSESYYHAYTDVPSNRRDHACGGSETNPRLRLAAVCISIRGSCVVRGVRRMKSHSYPATKTRQVVRLQTVWADCTILEGCAIAE
eukprot:6400624-Pyramimonas_sp.AAC.2